MEKVIDELIQPINTMIKVGNKHIIGTNTVTDAILKNNSYGQFIIGSNQGIYPNSFYDILTGTHHDKTSITKIMLDFMSNFSMGKITIKFNIQIDETDNIKVNIYNITGVKNKNILVKLSEAFISYYHDFNIKNRYTHSPIFILKFVMGREKYVSILPNVKFYL